MAMIFLDIQGVRVYYQVSNKGIEQSIQNINMLGYC